MIPAENSSTTITTTKCVSIWISMIVKEQARAQVASRQPSGLKGLYFLMHFNDFQRVDQRSSYVSAAVWCEMLMFPNEFQWFSQTETPRHLTSPCCPQGGGAQSHCFSSCVAMGFDKRINIPIRKVTIPDHTIGGGGPAASLPTHTYINTYMHTYIRYIT